MAANDLLLLIALIVLAGFVGFAVISKVPNSCLLYTSPSPRD